jgi:hypothetical protein
VTDVLPTPTLPGVRPALRRLGERTCVIGLGDALCRDDTLTADELTAAAAVQGCRDYVFDLTAVLRFESPALHDVAALWRRLADYGCAVVVAAYDRGLVAELRRAPTESAGWELAPTVADALRDLLGRPVE